MKSRMDRYFNDSNEDIEKGNVKSRASRNKDLYKEVSSLELNDFDVNNNESVILKEAKEVDLEKIKDIIDEKYSEKEDSKSLGIYDDSELPKVHLDETREYDITNILEKAKQEKEVDYEQDRLKKLKNTQYDILKSLNIEKEEEVDSKEIDEDNSSTDPLDLLSDLKGDDDTTKVLGVIENTEENDTINEENEEVSDSTEEQNFDTTDSLKIDESDYDDFEDLKEDMKATKIAIKLLTFVLLAVILVGVVFFLNKFLNLNIF